MKISIIMSAYNAEMTIGKAIDSCLNQTYKDIELLVINDASTDKTKEVVDSYDDERLVVINHESNLGAGWARHNGIKAATGDYITFCDSDDWYDLTYIEDIIKYTDHEGTPVDVISCGMQVHEGENIVNKIPDEVFLTDSLYHTDKADTCRFMNLSFIKKELWDKVEYSTRRYIEDSPTWIKILALAKNRWVVSYSGYHYYQRPTSLIHTASPYKNGIFQILCAIDSYKWFKGQGLNSSIDFKMILYKLIEGDFKTVTLEDFNLKDEVQEILTFINNELKNLLCLKSTTQVHLQ